MGGGAEMRQGMGMMEQGLNQYAQIGNYGSQVADTSIDQFYKGLKDYGKQKKKMDEAAAGGIALNEMAAPVMNNINQSYKPVMRSLQNLAPGGSYDRAWREATLNKASDKTQALNQVQLNAINQSQQLGLQSPQQWLSSLSGGAGMMSQYGDALGEMGSAVYEMGAQKRAANMGAIGGIANIAGSVLGGMF